MCCLDSFSNFFCSGSTSNTLFSNCPSPHELLTPQTYSISACTLGTQPYVPHKELDFFACAGVAVAFQVGHVLTGCLRVREASALGTRLESALFSDRRRLQSLLTCLVSLCN